MQGRQQAKCGWFGWFVRRMTALWVFAAALCSVNAGADTCTWSTNTTGAAEDGPGTWNTATANWVGSGNVHTAWNNANGDTAAFGAGGTAGTVTVDSGGVTVGGLTFNAVSSGTYTLSGGPLTLTGSPVFDAEAGATMNVLITGTTGFTKTGAGTLTFKRADCIFTGNVTLTAGTTICAANSSAGTNSVLGLSNVSRTITVKDGAVLQFNAHDTFGSAGFNPALTISAENGSTIRNQSTFTTFGPLNLINSYLISSGGANSTWQAYQLKGTVTSGGSSAIETAGGSCNGVHLYNTTFAVTNGSLTISAPLINKPGGSTAGLTKFGAGAMLLTGNNTFSGNVVVSNGLLQVGEGGSTGSLGTGAGAVSLVNADVSLVFDRSGATAVSGAISGAGSVIQQGAGVLSLSGANSYAGGTLISSGVLAATTTNALPGYATAGNVTLASGAGLSVGVGSWSVSEINALTATGIYGSDTLFGFDTTAGNYTYTGQFTVPSVAGIVKTGPYALTLSSATGCAGGVTVLSGILKADFGTGLPATTNVTLSGASLSSAGGSVTAPLGTGAGEINLESGTASGFSAVDVPLTVNSGGAGATLEWGTTAFNPGVLLLNDTGANTNLTFVNGLNLNGATRTVTVNATGAGAAAEISSVIADGTAAAGFVKSGTGTLKLSAANTYSGGTTVSAGTLALTGGDNRLNTAGSITLSGGTLDLGGGTQAMTAGTFSMADGTTLQNGTINYRNAGWGPYSGGSVAFAAGGGFVSPSRLLFWDRQTLTLAADAGVSAFGGDGGGTCNFLGVDNANTNQIVVNGGTLAFTNLTNGAGYLRLGCNGDSSKKPTGVLTVNGGVVNVGHSMSMGTRYDNSTSAAYGEGTLTLSGGEVNVGTGTSTATNNGCQGWFYLGNNAASTVSKSTINLNGGTLSLARLESGSYGANTVNLNGGTLKARADGRLINGSSLVCNVFAGGAVIDTAGFDVGINAALSGIGSLTKRGEGTLILTGSNTLGGAVSVEAGTLTLSPLSTASLKLHLDASDASTLFQNSDGSGAVTGSGQQVGCWGDLSGNGKPATQSESSRRPTYVTDAAGFNGLPVLQFDGSDDDITSSLDLNATNMPDVTIMMVYRKVSQKVNGGLWGHDDGSWDRMQLLDFGSVGTDKISGDNTSVAVNGMNTTNAVIYSAVLRNGVANGSYVYIDGVSDGSDGLAGFTSKEVAGRTYMTIANISSGNGYRGNIQLGEVLVFDAALSDAARQNVEAYLRAKWLDASAPVMPVLQAGAAIEPAAEMFTGLKLWLDASKISSLSTNSDGTGAITAAGQQVGCWGDLSGDNKPATQSTSSRRPSYVTDAAGFNGRPVLQFDGSDDDITSSLDFNAANLPNVTLFIVYKQLEKTGNAGLWGHDNGDWDRMQLFCNGTTCYQIAAAGCAVSVKGMETNKVTLYTAVLQNGVANGSCVYINGQSDATHGLPAFTSTEGSGQTCFTLGNISPGNGYRGAVQIGEVMIFDSALSDRARGSVEAYLRSKWTGQTTADGIQLAAGTVLDLDGAAQTLASVAGGGTISNGTLTVTEPLSPGGDGVIGTLCVADAALIGTLRIDAAADGTGDQLIASGVCPLSGLTLQIVDTTLLTKGKAYTVATCSGTLTGSFASNNLPDNWHILYDEDAGTVKLYYTAPGMVILVH